jgi:hypothetical protein
MLMAFRGHRQAYLAFEPNFAALADCYVEKNRIAHLSGDSKDFVNSILSSRQKLNPKSNQTK